jgi:hypothetical protein
MGELIVPEQKSAIPDKLSKVSIEVALIGLIDYKIETERYLMGYKERSITPEDECCSYHLARYLENQRNGKLLKERLEQILTATAELKALLVPAEE